MGLLTARVSPPIQSASRSLWRVLAVCIFWIVTSLQTSAVAETCGHYLFRNGHPVDASKGLVLSEQARVDSVDALSGSQNPWQPGPCNGLGCRQHSIPLSAPPIGPVTTAASEFGMLFQSMLKNDLKTSERWLPASETGHFNLPQPVFRPPIA
jgi:hypothetical protein